MEDHFSILLGSRSWDWAISVYLRISKIYLPIPVLTLHRTYPSMTTLILSPLVPLLRLVGLLKTPSLAIWNSVLMFTLSLLTIEEVLINANFISPLPFPAPLSTAAQCLFALRTLKNHDQSSDASFAVCTAHLVSRVMYALQAWWLCSQADNTRFQSVMCKASWCILTKGYIKKATSYRYQGYIIS